MQAEQERTETGAETPGFTQGDAAADSYATGIRQEAAPAVLIREYLSVAEYAADAPARAAEGWRLLSVILWDQRAGFWRGILLWFWALIWRPAPHLLCTYVREG